jgi:hypothetical protein
MKPKLAMTIATAAHFAAEFFHKKLV